jgi:OmpA-OmpF porin, OOP family
MKKILYIVLSILCVSAAALSEQMDAKGTKDHPLFTRMPGYWIHGCDQREFDAHKFTIAPGKTIEVEGKYYSVRYYPQNTLTQKPSELQILRNFENAVVKLGGKLLTKDKSRETLTLIRDGKEYWIEVWAEFTGKYGLNIMEKGTMAQDIVANADAFANDLKATGHSAVYGIYFDTGKFDLKSESNQAVGEIAKLLKNDAGLKVYIVGHTDNVGTVDANKVLSEKRANAVVHALISDHGISVSRLMAFGNGPYAPVSTNETDEGKAKNRRVEIVKQ